MIHIPEPLPDELASGHLGRIYALNGIETQFRGSGYINKFAPSDSNQGMRTKYLETLASLAGQTFSHYLFHHSLLPFYHAVQVVNSKSWNPNGQNSLKISLSALRASPLGALLCPCCIEEDIAFWGFSYWRRSHQLPGLNWCTKHHQSLLKTKSNAPLRLMPQEALANAEALDPGISTLAMQNSTIFRYGEICTEFLGRNRSISTSQIVSCLQQRARKLQLRPRAGVTGSHLHDIAMQQANGRWLLEHFPDIPIKKSSSSLSRTYTSIGVAYAAMYYALALALLYESVDEAFNDLSAAAELDIALGTHHFPGHPDDGGDETFTKLQRAMGNFLGGMPVDQACRKTGVKLEVLEELLRAASKRGLSADARI